MNVLHGQLLPPVGSSAASESSEEKERKRGEGHPVCFAGGKGDFKEEEGEEEEERGREGRRAMRRVSPLALACVAGTRQTPSGIHIVLRSNLRCTPSSSTL